MNALQLTALVVFIMAVAWLHHHAAHGTLRPRLRAVGVEILHAAVAVLLGLAAGTAYYLGWCATWP